MEEPPECRVKSPLPSKCNLFHLLVSRQSAHERICVASLWQNGLYYIGYSQYSGVWFFQYRRRHHDQSLAGQSNQLPCLKHCAMKILCMQEDNLSSQSQIHRRNVAMGCCIINLHVSIRKIKLDFLRNPWPSWPLFHFLTLTFIAGNLAYQLIDPSHRLDW